MCLCKKVEHSAFPLGRFCPAIEQRLAALAKFSVRRFALQFFASRTLFRDAVSTTRAALALLQKPTFSWQCQPPFSRLSSRVSRGTRGGALRQPSVGQHALLSRSTSSSSSSSFGILHAALQRDVQPFSNHRNSNPKVPETFETRKLEALILLSARANFSFRRVCRKKTKTRQCREISNSRSEAPTLGTLFRSDLCFLYENRNRVLQSVSFKRNEKKDAKRLRESKDLFSGRRNFGHGPTIPRSPRIFFGVETRAFVPFPLHPRGNN